MLSDAEQRRLAEIETLLRVDDPDFVRRFDKRRFPPRRRSILALLAIALGWIATVVALASGSLVAAVVGLAVSIAACGVWLSHRCGKPVPR